MNRKRILVVANDDDVARFTESTLTLDGYFILRASDAIKGFDAARLQQPDLVIIDFDMPRMDAVNLSRRLRLEKDTHRIPVLMLTGTGSHPEDRFSGLKMGADDYVQKPLLPHDLSIKVSRLLIRTEEFLSVNPLTKLPGSYSLEAEITKRIEDNEIFAACYFDIDGFKQFNDHYGYEQGDRIIRFLSRLISNTARQAGVTNDFLAHVDGDDFILVTQPDKVKDVCEQVIAEFKRVIPDYYSDLDRKNGFIAILDRKGEKHRYPLMTLSVAVVTNENHVINHYAKLLDLLSEMKHYAKEQPGSVWVKDRRHDTVRI